MCLICIEYAKEKMTIGEAYRALGEMKNELDKEHIKEILNKLDEDWWVEWLENMPQTD